MFRLIAILSGALAIVLTIAAPAHADDQSYLNELRADGVQIIDPTETLARGYSLCGALHNGMSHDTASNYGFGWAHMWGPQLLDAAQHNLCPDTLH